MPLINQNLFNKKIYICTNNWNMNKLKSMRKAIFITLIGFTLTSQAQVNRSKSLSDIINKPVKPVSNEAIVEGLKSALKVGIENAVGKLGVDNGFYHDATLKLLLPPDAKPITNNIKLIPGGQDLLNKTILSINRTAEDAVKKATPIFINAIKQMSIQDAVSILYGNENAATEYLRKTTYPGLKAAFAPNVKVSLNKPLVACASTNQTWDLLCKSYNGVANSMVGRFSKMKPVNVNLEDYVTEKALDALFIKVEEEEKAIRSDPKARITSLLQDVFGKLDKK